MFSEQKRFYAICKKENYPEEQIRKICQVINTIDHHEAHQREIMKEEGIVILSYAGLPAGGEQSEYEAIRSPEPAPEEVLIRKERTKILREIIQTLPDKYRVFVTAVLDNDCSAVFEETKKDKRGLEEKLSHILNISTRTVRRRIEAVRPMIFEAGKEYYLN